MVVQCAIKNCIHNVNGECEDVDMGIVEIDVNGMCGNIEIAYDD
ncbi:hypothetical protein [Petroclostridium sp. X23]|nr:hypothetical protein [Petroclostridium sp. X23]WHH59146.1 hypothetical protein QKW49_25730 [Petroclostridium sp. X23]